MNEVSICTDVSVDGAAKLVKDIGKNGCVTVFTVNVGILIVTLAALSLQLADPEEDKFNNIATPLSVPRAV